MSLTPSYDRRLQKHPQPISYGPLLMAYTARLGTPTRSLFTRGPNIEAANPSKPDLRAHWAGLGPKQSMTRSQRHLSLQPPRLATTPS